MSFLLAIVDVYFGNTNQSGDTFKFWPLFNVVIGTFIGALCALGTAYLMYTKNKKNQEDHYIKDKNDKLRESYFYFISMVRKIPDIVQLQIAALDNYIKVLDSGTLNPGRPGVSVSTVLKRLSETNDDKMYLHGYINSSNEANTTENFMELYQLIDHKYLVLKSYHEYTERSVTKRERDLLSFHSATNELEVQIIILMNRKEWKENNQTEYNALKSVFTPYYIESKSVNSSDLRFPITHLVEPIFKAVSNLVVDDSSEEFNHVMRLTRQAHNAFQEFENINKVDKFYYQSVISRLLSGMDVIESFIKRTEPKSAVK